MPAYICVNAATCYFVTLLPIQLIRYIVQRLKNDLSGNGGLWMVWGIVYCGLFKFLKYNYNLVLWCCGNVRYLVALPACEV